LAFDLPKKFFYKKKNSFSYVLRNEEIERRLFLTKRRKKGFCDGIFKKTRKIYKYLKRRYGL